MRKQNKKRALTSPSAKRIEYHRGTSNDSPPHRHAVERGKTIKKQRMMVYNGTTRERLESGLQPAHQLAPYATEPGALAIACISTCYQGRSPMRASYARRHMVSEMEVVQTKKRHAVKRTTLYHHRDDQRFSDLAL